MANLERKKREGWMYEKVQDSFTSNRYVILIKMSVSDR
jgi:hypothetical protein